MLHIVNKSPFDKNSLESCLSCAQDGSAVLLYEDGVYGAIKGSVFAEKLQTAMTNITVYALEPDVKARGIADKVIDGIKLVDYDGFVALTAEKEVVNSWL
ncbi:MAG TPA: sulfurtransferase complex subunit TusB [Ectothiorhodospiraceae bacterium]|nr:sulfurtransferase complex subunit TusB [Ectothiorhodospiraceae bacterium]